MQRQSIFKIISILLGVLLSLLLAEVAYRIYHFASYSDMKDIRAGKRNPVVSPDEAVKLGEIILLSIHRNIVYELIPSSKYRFQGALVETNSNGFKDREYPKSKQKRTFRIVGLGDSVMFGWGVGEADCYLTKLEDKLNEQDSKSVEVINSAVPGYNTVMEVATFAHKFELETVDMVIINFVGNDLDLPNFIRKKPAYFGIKKSFILQRFEENDGNDRNLQEAPFNEAITAYQRDADKVPPEYRHLVGEESYNAAMKELAQLQTKYGFKVIVLSTDPMGEYPTFVKRTCENLGFELLEIWPYWQKYKSDNPNAVWVLSNSDGHPSAVGHSVIAVALQDKMARNKAH